MTNSVLIRNMQFKEGKFTYPVIPIPIATVSSTSIKHTIRSSPRPSVQSPPYSNGVTTNPWSEYIIKSCNNPYAKNRTIRTTVNLSHTSIVTDDDHANALRYKNLMDMIVSNKAKYKREAESNTESDYEQCSQWFVNME